MKNQIGQTMKKMENMVAVITGGISGMGLATAELFKEEGAKVIVNARSTQRLVEAREDLNGRVDDIILADVAKTGDLEVFFKEVADRHGKIDVLFLNAGIAVFAPIQAVDEQMFDQLIDVNLKGVFFGIQKALPYLNDGASIILNTSIANQSGTPNTSVYSATKAAVRSIARSVGAELVERKIRVNAISPGPIETPIFNKMGMPEEEVTGLKQFAASLVPMGRMGDAKEIAAAALFLASSDSSFITGTELVVDGGSTQF